MVAEFSVVFLACAVTRSMAKKSESDKKSNDIDVDFKEILSFVVWLRTSLIQTWMRVRERVIV